MGWTREKIQEFTADLPHGPGVYIMRDRRGRVVYVGKARDLHARVIQYFRESGDPRPFVRLLSDVLGRLETVVTATEQEALILENELIKKHRPPFNIMLKDDKAYLYLKIDVDADFPRVELSRRRSGDGALYFGPSHSAAAIRETHALVNMHFGLRTCPDSQFRTRRRPCLEWQMKRCAGPCCGKVSATDYRERADAAVMFLRGRHQDVIRQLEARMKQAAEGENFEEAARLRDQVRAVQAALARQAVVLPGSKDVDAVGFTREGDMAVFAILRFESGVLRDCVPLVLENVVAPDEEIGESVLVQYYSRSPVPSEILVPAGLIPGDADDSALAAVLSARSGKPVRIRTPHRGAPADALKMAGRNADEQLRRAIEGAGSRSRALEALQSLLGLAEPPQRIEGYDMSQFQAAEPVGSMVVITNGRLDKRSYRTYSVKWDQSRGDTGFMHEVLTRRLSKLDAGQDRPDLIMLDGGPSQVLAATAVMRALDLDIPIVGLAKSRVLDRTSGAPVHSPERLFVPARSPAPESPGIRAEQRPFFEDPAEMPVAGVRMIVCSQNDPGLHLLMRLRDEAHRFAVKFHRKLRNRHGMGSILDGIPGLGKVRRTALLRHFKTIAAIRGASLEELSATPGIPRAVAAGIFEKIHGRA